MSTTIKGITISSQCSLTIQKWIKEVDLHTNVHGKKYPATVKKACEIILEDFAETLRLSEEELDSMKMSEQRLKEIIGNDWK